MDFRVAKRLELLPPYLFEEVSRLKEDVINRGIEVIDFGVGDPDLGSPDHVVSELCAQARVIDNHHYPSYIGLKSFREAVSHWYRERFGVDLDPEGEVLTLIGSKEGIGHIPLAFVNPGDVVLVPDPGYPVYRAGTILAGGEPYPLPLLRENEFLPVLGEVDEYIARRAKLMFINYPNNPTAAVASRDFFSRVVEFAQRYGIIVCHDAAYSEIAFDGYKPPSFLEVPGAKEVGIEFHSLSKTYNMTGWRIGFAVGNREVLSGLGKVKTNLDSGVFQALQYAGISALKGSRDWFRDNIKVFQRRRDLLVEGLRELGWEVEKPQATFYVWMPVPDGSPSMDFSLRLLRESGIVVTPGMGFGRYGEGFIRMALTVDEERIKEALHKLRNVRL